MIINLSRYGSLGERNRAYMIYAITVTLVILFSLFVVFVPTGPARETYLNQINDPQPLFSLIVFYAAAVVTFFLLRTGRLELAAWGPIVMWAAGPLVDNVAAGFVNASNGVALVGAILLAALLKERDGLIVGLTGALVALVVGILLREGFTPADLPPHITEIEPLLDRSTSDLITLSLLIIGFSGLMYLFLGFVSVSRREGAEEAVEDRVLTAEIVSQIAQRVAQRSSLSELLTDITSRINNTFDFLTHAQVYLIDETGFQAARVATTVAEASSGERIQVGSGNIIGQVMSTGKMLRGQADASVLAGPRPLVIQPAVVQAVFPLRIGQKVIGAVDLQSADALAFEALELQAAFQALTDSVALAVDNVSQFERAEARLKENQRLVEETREALRQVERLNDRLTGAAWTNLVRSREESFGLAIDFDNGQADDADDWTPTLRDAMITNQIVQDQHDDNAQVIAVPLRVRGRVIGAMEFELGEDAPFTPEDLDLLQEVGERFGLAMENARLVDESQRAAQREALVNRINTRLQSTNDVDNMLNEAARGIKDALQAHKVAIRLGTPPPASRD